jgi:hypothetical protein
MTGLHAYSCAFAGMYGAITYGCEYRIRAVNEGSVSPFDREAPASDRVDVQACAARFS